MSYSETLLKTRYASAGWETSWEDVVIRMLDSVIPEKGQLYQELKELMTSGTFLPSSPQLWGFGSQEELSGVPVSGSSCYTLSIKDSLSGIWGASSAARDVYKASGGAGFNLSCIRPRSAIISRSPRPAAGVLPVCQLLDWTTRYITAGGRSRGALMVQLDCDHPDVVEFLLAKRPILRGGDYDLPLTQCNMSVRCSDSFWKAVDEKAEWPLSWQGQCKTTTWEELKERYQDAADCISDTKYKLFHRYVIIPRLKNLSGTIYAHQLFDLICENAHNHADPGVVNSDIYEMTNPTPQLGKRHSNPCLIGSTMVQTEYGPMRLDEVVETFDPLHPIKVVAGDGKLRPLSRAFHTGINEVLDITFEDGSCLTTTLNHSFITSRGKVCAQDLVPGDQVPYRQMRLSNEEVVLGALNATLFGNTLNREDFPKYVVESPAGWSLSPAFMRANKQEIDLFLNEVFKKHADKFLRLRIGSKDLLLQIQLLLSAVGTHSTVTDEGLAVQGDKVFGGGLPETKTIKAVIRNGKSQKTYNLTEPVTGKVSYGTTVTYNCSEYIAPAGGSCDLGSINLSALVVDGEMDWAALERATQLAVRWLNLVIDRNKYPIDYVKEVSSQMRNIGIGVMGLHDALMLSGYRYDSEAGREQAALIMAKILLAGWEESFRLDKTASAWNSQAMEKIFDLYASRAERHSWPEIAKRFRALKTKGVAANTTITSIAPTGTISLIAGFLNGHSGVSSGAEPVFSWDVVTRQDSNGTVEIKHWLHDQFSKDHLDAMHTAPEDHIAMLGALSEFVSMAVSKTINLPEDATVDDVKKAYRMAHKLEVPGVTVYRDKSKPTQVLYAGAPTQEKPSRKRPQILKGETHRVQIVEDNKSNNIYVTVNTVGGDPYEVFVSGLEGASSASIDGICRITSLSLRNQVPLADVIKQLDKVNGSYLYSLPNQLSRILKGYMASTITKQCFVCDKPTEHLLKGGCATCPECGSSAC